MAHMHIKKDKWLKLAPFNQQYGLTIKAAIAEESIFLRACFLVT